METVIGRKVAEKMIHLSDLECPACGSSERWDGIVAQEPPANNPEVVIHCDCGLGEIVVRFE